MAPLLRGQRIAVARDAAFAFIYTANLDTLRALGAELVFFSPLAGDVLPTCNAVWLPGGYPELHAARLAERTDLRAQLADHVNAGRPLWAECGGLMALADTLVDGQGVAHKLWGLLPGTAVLGKRLAALGPHAWTVDGQALRGHSFHWSRFDTALQPWQHTQPARGVAAGAGEPVYRHRALRASWFHPWFASAPALAAQLFLPR
jgi:cobyrinic acid a,c-diamide synthase